MKKLGLSAYENDSKPTDKKFAYIIDESIMVNREKLLLILGIPAEHLGRPLKHEDVTVVSMKSGGSFKGDDIKLEIEKSIKVLKTVDIRSPKTGISVHFSYSLPMAMQIY